MRRGKGKTQRNPIRKMAVERKPETQNPQEEEEEEREVDEDEEEGAEEKGRAGKGFYACYLLTSLCPRFRGHTYIGFTVNPRRRIRQHNGEIRSGAWRTKKRRPWEMVFCLYGFPNNVSALQFEWAWQHPTESLAVRQAAATFKSFSGVSNKIKLAFTMLNLPSWSSLGITVNYFSTKYEKHSVGCPALPEHMKVRVCPIEDLPCYTETFDSFSDDGDAKECLGDSEEHEEDSATVNADNLELQGHFVDEPRCYDRMEDCLLDSVNDKNSNVDERYDEHGIEKTFYGKFGWEGECSSTWCSDPVATEMGYVHPPTPEIDREQPFGVINSLARTSSSTVTSETGDGHILTSTDKSILKLGYWSRGEKFKTKEEVVKDQQTCHSSSFQHGIEVIDLLSPSPKSRIRPTTKKRSVSTVCPEIIDLT